MSVYLWEESIEVEVGAWCFLLWQIFGQISHSDGYLRCVIFLLENEYTIFHIFLQWDNEKKEIKISHAASV